MSRPETSAPPMRLVDQHTGTIADVVSPIVAAVVEADDYHRLEQDNIALTRRVDELEDALREEKQHSQALWSKLMAAEQKLRRLQNKGW